MYSGKHGKRVLFASLEKYVCRGDPTLSEIGHFKGCNYFEWVCFTCPPPKCNEQESPHPIGLIFKKALASVVRLTIKIPSRSMTQQKNVRCSALLALLFAYPRDFYRRTDYGKNGYSPRVISSAINSACFKTVSVANFRISGG